MRITSKTRWIWRSLNVLLPSNRADHRFVSAEIGATGTPVHWWATADRNRDGTLTYTKRGPPGGVSAGDA